LLLTIGGGLASPAFAEIKTHKTIAARTAIQVGNCEDLGGTADVETTKGSVTNGHQVIKTKVTCTGGGMDGTTCTNVKGSTNCISRVGPTGGGSAVGGQVIGSEQVSDAEQATATPGAGQVNISITGGGVVEQQLSTPTPLPTFGNPIPTITVEAVQPVPQPTATPDAGNTGIVVVYQAQPEVVDQAP
jgi:hypothetical protein